VEVEEVQPDRHASVVTRMKAERHKRTLGPSDCSVRFGPRYCFGRLDCMRNTPAVVVVAAEQVEGPNDRCNPDWKPGTHSDPVLMRKSGLANHLAGVMVVAVARHLVHTQDQTDTHPLQASVTAVGNG
jgi:hypothetical protein